MPLLQTDAIVLHTADYLESSRLLRLLTREAGVLSVVARGARSSKKRFGSAVDLFAEGQAQIQVKPGRDLHALNGFDVSHARTGLATDLARFTAASTVSEVVARVIHDESAPQIYKTVAAGLERLETHPTESLIGETVGMLWHLLAETGYRPSIDQCAECQRTIGMDESARFVVPLGGVICAACSQLAPTGRLLPPDVRATLRRWLADAPADGAVQELLTDQATARAHQRLLREFLAHHLHDPRPLKAWKVWENGDWTDARK
jgi:DNA repair protein RecO (recombination protein O)